MNFNEAKKRNSVLNRLSSSNSPYLLQHQYNPIDWFPWCNEAFEKAKQENKPVFLSIGYSSCHWCHVMAEETFENREIADFLNTRFVSIKVDREERPDIDRVYMNFVQATAGQGGWPLSVFLTPDAKPFFGGTYFPPYSKYGRIGFMDVLQQIHRAWTERGKAVVDSANEILIQFKQWFEKGAISKDIPSEKALHIAATSLKSSFDVEHGGFGEAPKFPQPSVLRFLLYYGVKCGDTASLQVVQKTCKAMAVGGIHDPLGGGFHRYSVDSQWTLPHFEKMLYDNALLLLLYCETYLVFRNPFFSEVVRKTTRYLSERLRSPNGGFFSAEDADSEGEEGKYYLWSYDELKRTLAPYEFELAKKIFDLQPAGNFVDPLHPSGTTGNNILRLAQMPSEDEQPIFENIIQKLTQARNNRTRPFRDEKVLTAWNGYAIAALSRSGFILSDPAFLKLAADCISFIKTNLYDQQSHLLFHSWFNGKVNKSQIQEDYAAFIWGLIEYHQATLDSSAIKLAVEIAESMLEKFEDNENGGFWQSPRQDNELIYNMKDSYDGATPSGNSLSAGVLLRLYDITGHKAFIESAERTFRFYYNQLTQQSVTLTEMLVALSLYWSERLKIAISPNNSPEFIREYLHLLSNFYLPHLTSAEPTAIAKQFDISYASNTIYICSDKQCFEPITDMNRLSDFLKRCEFTSS
ncbi:MAG: thioredoxin domain-containing protein [Verrucomicrobiae bacterium]|nr:thioredoxin domain-containing protein [Verrucomicrobiae bacterium]